jgi:hypothetical protein
MHREGGRVLGFEFLRFAFWVLGFGWPLAKYRHAKPKTQNPKLKTLTPITSPCEKALDKLIEDVGLLDRRQMTALINDH